MKRLEEKLQADTGGLLEKAVGISGFLPLLLRIDPSILVGDSAKFRADNIAIRGNFSLETHRDSLTG